MSDNEVYTEIKGKPVCISKIDARVISLEQQEKLKRILRKMQKATIVDMGIDAAYIAVLELERKEKGIPTTESRIGSVTVNIPGKEVPA